MRSASLRVITATLKSGLSSSVSPGPRTPVQGRLGPGGGLSGAGFRDSLLIITNQLTQGHSHLSTITVTQDPPLRCIGPE